jgi:hypothetical protein
MIINKKVIRDLGYELYEQEWNNYKQEIINIVKKIISTPYLLIPYNLEDTVQNFPAELRTQKSETDNFRSLILTFMMLYDIRVGIYKDNSFIRDKFPLRLGELDICLYKKYLIKGNFIFYYNFF